MMCKMCDDQHLNDTGEMSKIDDAGPKPITSARPFTEQLCDHCDRDNPEIRLYCPIVTKALVTRFIPQEWSLDPKGNPHCTKFAASCGGKLGASPKESPLPDQKGVEKGDNSFGEELLDAGYDNGFGVTSLDTLLCEQMSRAERLDFAAFLIRAVRDHDISRTIPNHKH